MPLKPGLLLALLSIGKALFADGSASLHIHHFEADNGLVGTSPAFEAGWEPDPRTELALKYDADAVSAASFNYARSKTHRDGTRPAGSCWTCHPGTDALSGASRSYTELRHGLAVGVKRKGETHQLAARYSMSRENDYASDMGGLRWQGDFFGQNSSFSLDLQAMLDRVSAVTRPGFEERLQSFGADLGFTQILAGASVLSLGWSAATASGFQQNPYAFVQPGADKDHPQRVNQPREKTRQVATLTLKQGLPWEAALQGDYRYYADSWEVSSHTVELTLSQALGWLVLEPGFRWYSQPTGASFFKNRYDGSEAYLTRDLKLAPHSTQSWSVGLRGPLGGGWNAELGWTWMRRMDSLDYGLYYADKPETAQITQLVFTYE